METIREAAAVAAALTTMITFLRQSTTCGNILITTFDIPTDDGKTEQKTKWSCKTCGTSWAGKKSRKALAHGTRDDRFCLKEHIKPCKGKTTEAEAKLFTDLYDRKLARRSVD